MVKKLEHLLNRLPFEDLKKALGKEVCELVEYLTDDLTGPSLVKIAVRGYGKSLLEKTELRTLLLVNCLSTEKILELSKSLKIKERDLKKIILKVGKIPYADDERSLLVLSALGLNEDFLSDKADEKEANVIKLAPRNHFYEQLDYQFDLRMQVLKFLREIPNARALLHMPTGAGKTKTAMHIINEYLSVDNNSKGIIIWLANTEILLKQAHDTFANLWKVLGKKNIDCIKFWGNLDIPKDIPECGFIFAGIQKLISAIKKDNHPIRNYIDNVIMIIIDEAHKAPASETYKAVKVLLEKNSKTPNRVLLGLTATPGRKHGFDIEDMKLKNLFEGVKFGVDLSIMKKYTPGSKSFKSVIKYLQYRKILSTFEREEISFNPSELTLSVAAKKQILQSIIDDSRDISYDVLDKLAKSKTRNILIINKLKELYFNGSHTIFFACNIEHAKLITAALNLENIKCGLILGNTPSSQRNAFIDDFQDVNSDMKILINVEVLTTGFDAPLIDCVFIARPVSSIILYSQIIGRGIRGPMMGGNETCKLVEVVDDFQLGDESWAFKYFDEYWK